MIETVRDIAFDDPVNALPGMHNFAERGMASPSRPESMRVIAEARLKVGIQQLPYDLLHHF